MIGSVPFPVTTGAVGAGYGVAVASTTPVVSTESYRCIAQSRGTWFVDSMFIDDTNTFAAILSALNLLRAGQMTYLTLNGIPRDVNLSGASCGAAVFLALMGITSDVLVTGFIQSFGLSNPSLTMQAVDSVDEKVRWAISHDHKIVVPFSCLDTNPLLSRLYAEKRVTSFYGMVGNCGPDVYPVGIVDSITDAAFVLAAMDPGKVALRQFMPRHQSAVLTI